MCGDVFVVCGEVEGSSVCVEEEWRCGGVCGKQLSCTLVSYLELNNNQKNSCAPK